MVNNASQIILYLYKVLNIKSFYKIYGIIKNKS